MLKIKQFFFNPIGVSTFVVYDDESREAAIVDPGMNSSAEEAAFDKFIADNKLHVTSLVNTHLHLDHCFGDNYVRDRYGVKVAAHPGDAELGKALAEQAAMFGIPARDSRPVEIDIPLKEGDSIKVGSYELKVIHIPGHSPGSIGLYSPEGKILISGDVLFRGSIGRTDLPGGSHATLLDSIDRKIMTLPEDTTVLPGHDSPTTVGREKKANPFIK